MEYRIQVLSLGQSRTSFVHGMNDWVDIPFGRARINQLAPDIGRQTKENDNDRYKDSVMFKTARCSLS
jgi:hypothetical protein